MKKLKETFAESIFNLMISQVVVKILGLVYRLYLTNKEGFGDLGNAISGASFQIYALALSVTAIGIPNSIAKLVAQKSSIGDHKGAHKIFKISLLLFGTIGILASYLMLFFAGTIATNYLKIEESKLSIIALSPSIFLVSITSVFRGYFNGRESIKITSRAQSTEQLVKTVVAISLIELSILLTKKSNTVLMAALSNFSTTIGNLAEFIYLYIKYKKYKKEINEEILFSVNTEKIRLLSIIKEIMKYAMPISLSAIIMSISRSIDSVTIVNDLKDILGYEVAKKEYGILSGKVDTLINFPLSFGMAISGALLPTIAMYKDNLKLKEDRINKSILIEMLIAIPVSLIYCFYSNEILSILFPNASNGGVLLRISSFSIVFLILEGVMTTILNGIGRIYVPIKATFIGAIVKLILNKILIKNVNFIFGGTRGAALATLICHVVTCLILILEVRKTAKIKIHIKKDFKVLIATAAIMLLSKIMCLELSKYLPIKIGLIISFIISAIIFIITILKLKIIEKINLKLL